jgi:hypothetical protein
VVGHWPVRSENIELSRSSEGGRSRVWSVAVGSSDG